MATTIFYLDTRRAADKVFSLRINISHQKKVASYTLGVKLEKDQWNPKTRRVEKHPDAKYLNNIIDRRKAEVDKIILKLEDENPKELALMSAVQLRDFIVEQLKPEVEEVPEAPKKPKDNPNTVGKFFERYQQNKDIRESSKVKYATCWRRIEAWLGKEAAAQLEFKDITLGWIEEFDTFLTDSVKFNREVRQEF